MLTDEDIEYYKSRDWSGIENLLNEEIKRMKDMNYTEEQIIEELSKYVSVKFIDKED